MVSASPKNWRAMSPHRGVFARGGGAEEAKFGRTASRAQAWLVTPVRMVREDGDAVAGNPKRCLRARDDGSGDKVWKIVRRRGQDGEVCDAARWDRKRLCCPAKMLPAYLRGVMGCGEVDESVPESRLGEDFPLSLDFISSHSLFDSLCLRLVRS